MAASGTKNWRVIKDPKYSFDDIGFRRRGNNNVNYKPMVVNTKPPETERTQGRSLWKDVGENQEIRRMFVSSAFSTFAETMRPSLEKVLNEIQETFSDVIVKSIPYWDKLSNEDKDGWAERAKVEKKKDHYIYMRKVTIRDKPAKTREIVTAEFEECESDPDEMPGEMIPHETIDTDDIIEPAAPSREEAKPQSSAIVTRPKQVYAHRADALQNWVPANRQVRFMDDKKPIGNGHSYANKYKQHYNYKHYRENYQFRDAPMMDH